MRKKAYLIVLATALMVALPMAAQADIQINTGFAPANFFWSGLTDIGWDFTPGSTITVTEILSQFNTASNINNNTTLTLNVYDHVAGTVLESVNFNPALERGLPFATPLTLTAGTTYFIDYAGWNLNNDTGVNSAGIPDPNNPGNTIPPAGATLLPGFFNNNSAIPIAANSWPEAAILDIITAPSAVPLPPSALLLGSGLLGLVGFRRFRKS